MLPPSLIPLSLLLLLLLLLLTPAARAGGPPQVGSAVPPKVAPTKLDNFTWANPFSSPLADHRFGVPACESTRTFAAWEYQLHDLHTAEPLGLAPYGDALKGIFGGRPYPGGWDGIDAHGYERTLLKMDYQDVPLKVRAWIAAQETPTGPAPGGGKGLFAVYDRPKRAQRVVGTANLEEEQDEDRVWDAQRIVVFAPGAIYENLPLWVAEGSDCEATLENLEKYSPKLVDGGVVGWPTHYTTPSRRQGLRKMEFTIKAQVLSAQADASVKKEAPDTANPETRDEL